MAKACNLRYHHLLQLESEFAALNAGKDARRGELAREIVALRAEFGSRNAECERWLESGHE